ncbi:hypothetical protein PG990_007453 [Apiospora arundinis]
MFSLQTEHPKPQPSEKKLQHHMTIEPLIPSLCKLVKYCVEETKPHPSLEFGGIGSGMALEHLSDYWRDLLPPEPDPQTRTTDTQVRPRPLHQHHDPSFLYLFVITRAVVSPNTVLATLQLVLPKTGPTAQKCEIVNLMVANTNRRRGLARSLIEYAEGVGKMRGMSQITAHADITSSVHKLLELAGFENIRQVHKNLWRDPDRQVQRITEEPQ